jgi:hypothetical protein
MLEMTHFYFYQKKIKKFYNKVLFRQKQLVAIGFCEFFDLSLQKNSLLSSAVVLKIPFVYGLIKN